MLRLESLLGVEEAIGCCVMGVGGRLLWLLYEHLLLLLLGVCGLGEG